MNRYQNKSDNDRLIYRNKHFIDIKQLQYYDKQRQIINRMPQDFDNSSSLNKSMYKNKSFYKTNSSSFTKISKQTDTSRKVRGLSMNLSLPRKSFIEIEKGPVTQRNFNNFYLKKPNLANTFDIRKSLGREKFNVSSNVKEIGDDLTKKYEQFYYCTANKCLVNYKQETGEARASWVKRKEEDEPSTLLEDKKVYEAFLKVRTKSKSPLLFSKSLGKDVPSSLDRKILKDNQYFWTSKVQKDQIDVVTTVISKLRNAKNIMKEGKSKANPTRDQVCQGVYFRRKN